MSAIYGIALLVSVLIGAYIDSKTPNTQSPNIDPTDINLPAIVFLPLITLFAISMMWLGVTLNLGWNK